MRVYIVKATVLGASSWEDGVAGEREMLIRSVPGCELQCGLQGFAGCLFFLSSLWSTCTPMQMLDMYVPYHTACMTA